MISAAKILSFEEVKQVVAFLKAVGTNAAWLNLVIFRLSCCCGMRCKEIQGLNLHDFHPNGDTPYIVLPKEIVKGEPGRRKPRSIHIWWDWETYLDLQEWHDFRLGYTNGENGPFVAALRSDHRGRRMSRTGIAAHWTRTIRAALGPDRAKAVSIHCGRHTFTSLAHARDISLAEIRDALGHSSLAITDLYCHKAGTDVRDLFSGGIDRG